MSNPSASKNPSDVTNNEEPIAAEGIAQGTGETNSTAVEPPGLPPEPPRRRRSLRALVVLLLIISVAGFVSYRYFQTPEEVAAELTLLGNIDVRQVDLAFKVAGRIESLFVDEGDTVTAGQTLASLDGRYFEDSLRLAISQRDQASASFERLLNGSRPEEIEQAKAQEATALAALQRAKNDFQRAAELIDDKAISKQEFDASNAAVLEAEAALKSATASRELAVLGPRVEDIEAGLAQLNSAEAQLIIVQRQLADAQLVAPNDGVILTRAQEVGGIVNAGATVFTLTLSTPVWVRTYVGEPDLGSVQPGMQVVVLTDAREGSTAGDGNASDVKPPREYVGHVGFVSPTAEFTPKSVETRELRTSLVYRLRVVVDDPDGGLRQGMPVTVRVEVPGTRRRTFKERLLEAIGLEKFLK